MRNNQPVNQDEYVLGDNQSPISRTDLNSHITYVNADFVEASGFTEEELIGQAHNIVRHPDMPPEAFADMWRYLQAGRSWTGMVKNRRKDGGYYWVLANASPMWEQGAVVGYASVRMKPTAAQIREAEAAYTRIRAGGSGLRIERGRVLRTGLAGAWDKLNALNISGRVNVLVGSMILVMLGIGLAGIMGMRSANQQVTAMYREAALATQYLDTIARTQYRSQVDIATTLISQTPDKAQAAVNDIEHNSSLISKTWDTYLAIGHEENEKAVQQEFEALRAKHGAEGLKPALAALRKNDFVETQRIYNDIIQPQFEHIRRNVDAQLAAQDLNSQQAMQASDANYQILRASTLAAMVLGMALALFMGWRLRLSTVAPLNEAVAISKQIAAGALNNIIVPKSSDESGQLMAALFAMQRSLSSLAQGVLTSAFHIDMGALQIARGNESLAARTEEQATAVQEAATNMEEISTTVQQNIDNAKAANQLVQEAGGIASRAGVAMSQVVGTMDSIAGSSRRITDIISVIDGIAFQTNILALNAAVEAARAGEQGRGFAVVASEVRSLAKRSADAAKEIKSLIENSVQQVEGGLVQVSGARETLESTIGAVKHVGTLMAEILHSSDEQGAAIHRVAQLVVQIGEATQQNVPIAESAASASRSLAEHGQALERSAKVFRLA